MRFCHACREFAIESPLTHPLRKAVVSVTIQNDRSIACIGVWEFETGLMKSSQPDSEPIQRLRKILTSLQAQRAAGVQLATFLNDHEHNEDRFEKYRDSFSGNVLSLLVIGAHNSLVLFCARTLETSKDSLSIPNAVLLLEQSKGEIIREREELKRPFSDNALECLDLKIETAIKKSNDLTERQVAKAIRVIRTEKLAHSVENSRDRCNNFNNIYENIGISFSETYTLAKELINLIDSIDLIFSGRSNSFDRSSAVFQRYCDSFWEYVPIFRDIETAADW